MSLNAASSLQWLVGGRDLGLHECALIGVTSAWGTGLLLIAGVHPTSLALTGEASL